MFKIGRFEIGAGRCFTIGEVGCAHEGSLSLAHAYIEAIAASGFDCVKFQCHLAESESTPDEPWRVKPEYGQDVRRYDYWKRMEFTEEQWAGLKAHTEEKGLEFLASPFSLEAVELLKRLGVKAWKVASGEAQRFEMMAEMSKEGLPLLISTGMSNAAEIKRLGWCAQAPNAPMVLMQSTSMYPCPASKLGLGMLDIYRRHFGVAVGLSDHTGTIAAGIAAVTLGCDVLEVHVTLDEWSFLPDQAASLLPADLVRLVEGIRFIEASQVPYSKDAVAQELEPMRKLFGEKWKRKAQERDSIFA